MLSEPRIRLALMRSCAVLGLILTSLGAVTANASQPTFSPHVGAPTSATKYPCNKSIDPEEFVRRIDNPYYPLRPGTVFYYTGTKAGVAQSDVVTVTYDTKKIIGVTTVVVQDQAFEDGELIESTIDWYAQDDDGNVWYFGEAVKEYENGVVVSTEGSWQAGVNGAKPGIIMEGHPHVGDTYFQECAPDVAQDMAKVISMNKNVKVPYGSFDDVLQTKDTSALDPGIVEDKYYASGVGFIKEVATDEQLVLVNIKHFLDD